MAIFNTIDTGLFSLNQGPSSGIDSASVVVQGGAVSSWARAGKVMQRSTTINVEAPFAIGGAAAGSRQAVRYVVQQLVELAHNPNLQPVYIQWESGNGVLTPNPYDGWYRLDDVTPLDFTFNTFVPCRVSATWVAPPPPRAIALAYAGGALASNFNGVIKNLLGFPVGSTPAEASGLRAGGEGSIPTVLSPAATPEPVVLGATLSNAFKGGCHIYDTIISGGNPVPTAGLFTHANWVEVFDTHHGLVGDCVITNGLLLFLFQVGASFANRICVPYFWNTALATPAWQVVPLFWGIGYSDNTGGLGTLQQLSLLRVGAEECQLTASSTSSGQAGDHIFQLKRGHVACSIRFRPRTQSNTYVGALSLNDSSSPGIYYTDSKLLDPRIVADQGVVGNLDPTYGYTAHFDPTSSARSLIWGFLWQNQPTDQMFWLANRGLVIGDPAGPALNSERLYGFFAIPYGAPSHTVDHLQANANGGTLGTGWSSVVDANAQNGNAAKAASGTASGNADTFGASFVPRVANYDLWVRARVTSAAGGVGEMTFGFWINGTTLVAGAIFAANQFATGYTWVRVAVNFNTNSFTNTYQFRAVTNAILGTDWFIDEMVMVPKSMTEGGTDLHGPQDIWQQWMYERSTVLVPS